MTKTFASVLGGLFLLFVFIFPVQAHKVVISAYAEGPLIEGEIGFSGGNISSGTVVEVLDDDGNKLGETKTDAEGIFQFTPTLSIPHTFRANLGQGHIATYRLEVDELPEGLDGSDGPSTVSDASPQANKNPEENQDPASVSDAQKIDLDPVALEAFIRSGVKKELAAFKPFFASTVRKETKPLRKEIAAYKEKNNLQSILGGIGYIFGLFGVGFYILARRERSNAEAGNKAEQRNAE